MMAPLVSRRPPMLARSTPMSAGGTALDTLVAPARRNASTIWRSLMSMMVTAAPMASLGEGSRCGESGASGGRAQGWVRGCASRSLAVAGALDQRQLLRRELTQPQRHAVVGARLEE